MSETVRVLRCPTCARRYRAPVGRVVRCKFCSAVLVPEEDLPATAVDEAVLRRTTTATRSVSRRPRRRLPEGEIPERIGAYRVEAVVGEGGMGIVYRAIDEQLHRPVAIKVLRPEVVGRGRSLERFLQEAQAIARLRHPNLIKVFQYGEGEIGHFFVMDLVEGETLDRLIEERRLRLATKVTLFRDLVSALVYAHEHGVIHRDIKPSNVLVDPLGRPILTDFGVAKDVEKVSALTQDGASIGTPYYMAPEQLEGRVHEVDARSDLYSLGVLFFELLTGRRPFEAKSKGELYYKVVHTDAEFRGREASQIPPALRAICLKAMARPREERYPDARALLADVSAFLDGEPVAALGRKVTGRSIAVLVVAAVVLIALGFGGALYLVGPVEEPHPETVGGPDRPPDPPDDEPERPPDAGQEAARARAALGELRAALAAGQIEGIEAALGQVLEAGGDDPEVLTACRRLLVAELDVIGGLLDRDPATGERVRRVFGADDEPLGRLTTAWMGEASRALEREMRPEVGRLASRVLALYPEHFLARRLRADAHRWAGDHAEAASDYALLEGTPLEDQVEGDLVQCLVELGRTDEALPLLDRLLARNPEQGGSFALRGRLRFEAGQMEGARDDLQQAHRLGVREVEVYQMLGVSSFRLGDVKAALFFETLGGQIGGEGGPVEASRRLGQITNTVLGKLPFAAGPDYDLDFRVLPPRGNLKGLGEMAYIFPENANDWQENPLWHLKLRYRGTSSFRVWFDLTDRSRPVVLIVDHVSSGSPEGSDGRVRLEVNDQVVVDGVDIAGGARETYTRDITALCRIGTNSIRWQLAEDARTQYWLKRVQIIQE